MTTTQILRVLTVLAYLAFIGYSIEAGAIIVSSVVSYINPDAAKNLYMQLSFYNLRQLNPAYYIVAASLLTAIAFLKAFVWYLVIKALSTLNLENPFDIELSQLLERIAYVLLGTFVIGFIASLFSSSVLKISKEAFVKEGTMEGLLFTAALVFIISKIFRRGVEIQSENELTV